MSDTDLYEADFVLWTERQGQLLRTAAARRSNEPTDWDNLAEEIEGLGRSQRREVESLVRLIVIHLLKLDASPAEDPGRGWQVTILRSPRELRSRLRDSLSLRSTLQAITREEFASCVHIAALELEQHGEMAAAGAVRARRDPPTLRDIQGDDA